MNSIQKAIIEKLAICIIIYVIPVLVVFMLFFFIFAMIFLIPKYIVKDMEERGSSSYGKLVAIFNTGSRDDWKLEDDQKLYGKYQELNNNWLAGFMDQEILNNLNVDYCEGNAVEQNASVSGVWGRFYENDSGIPAEVTQVKQHIVNWPLLAAVDRVTGDPVITGLRGRRADPEGNFKKLKPELTWRNFELRYYCTWTENSSTDGEAPNSFTKIYKHNVKLLQEVKSYEADKIVYEWEAKQYSYQDSRTDFMEEAFYPVLKKVSYQGPYFGKLRNLLANYNLVKGSDIEFVLYLAMNFNQEFKYNTALISGNMTELNIDTENNSYFQVDSLGEKYQWPTGEYIIISSGFGWRMHSVLGDLRFHKGIDIVAPGGSPVFSVWDGEVIVAGWIPGYGKTVLINHGEYRSLYAHLMSLEVMLGQKVRQGDEIGKVGSTGLSTGEHLHFEIRSGIGETYYHDPLSVYNRLVE